MLEKAYLESEGGDTIPFLFNPTKFDISVTNKWETKTLTGKSAPVRYFAGGQGGKMSIPEMKLDTTDTGKPVTTHTAKLFKLMDIDTSLPGYNAEKNNGRPPWVKFHWGKTVSFKSIISTLSVNFTYFSSDGTPLRADTSLTLEQMEEDPKLEMQNPTSGTPMPHRLHWVRPGESLDRIAAQHYGAAGKWRVIADANGLHDPLDLRPGMRLVIPRLKGVMSG